jgi:hypothetical protein
MELLSSERQALRQGVGVMIVVVGFVDGAMLRKNARARK